MQVSHTTAQRRRRGVVSADGQPQLRAERAREGADRLEHRVASAALDAADLALAAAGGGGELVLRHVPASPAADEAGGETAAVREETQLGHRIGTFGFGLCHNERMGVIEGRQGAPRAVPVKPRTRARRSRSVRHPMTEFVNQSVAALGMLAH
jgi:hypothetical protein